MSKRKEFTGKVISDKMEKTVVVRVERLAKHAKYGRVIKKANKFKAHNEENRAKTGDIVSIEETRPYSKEKYFRVRDILKQSKSPEIEIKEALE